MKNASKVSLLFLFLISFVSAASAQITSVQMRVEGMT